MTRTITDIPGFKFGQAEDIEALTGCTVVLCDEGTVAGVDQRGGAPGTRETDALRPMHLIEHVHAVLLAGGSAYGLDAAAGVMKYLEENGIGYETGAARVPVVPAAILYDLGIGRADVRPDGEMGYRACQNALSGIFQEGNFGAGTGATVGKILGMGQAIKSGIGSACIEVADGLMVGAVIAVNAFGDVVDPESGKIMAGPRSADGYISTYDIMKSSLTSPPSRSGENTVIGIVATNATLSKEAANKVAQMAQNGLGQTIRPAHSMFDGDTLFALASGKRPEGGSPLAVSLIGQAAADAVAAAVLCGVEKAEAAGGLPSIHGH